VARSAALSRPSLGSLAAAARFAPLALLWVGAALLVVSEFLVLREIRAVTVVPPGGTVTGGSHHIWALAMIGVALAVMAYGAVLRGARPAALACLVLALAAGFIVLAVDRPTLDDTGLIGRTYDLAQARPAAGFYVESVGTALALVGAVAALVLAPRRGRPARRARPARED
jgi:hypothetical protein